MAGFKDTRRSSNRRLYLKSCLPACCSFSLIAILLSSLALLAHFHSPAAKQRLGWQAWDVVLQSSENRTGQGDGMSLPLDVWDPLLPHTTGLTEIIVSSCYISPILFPAFCNPPSTSTDDKLKGKWVRVEKDLNIRTGVWYLNVYYRRTYRLDAPVITDLRTAPYPIPSELQDELEGWTIAKGDLRSGVWPQQKEMRLIYKLSHMDTISDDTGSEKESWAETRQRHDVITELDVVYGDDDPFYGFERVTGGPVVKAEGDRWETVDLAFRRGSYQAPQAPEPVFHNNGTFKIMQIADLHYSVGKGECRDTDLDPCDGDAETARWLASALDIERPDMVVFSGDQLNGQKSSYDARSVLAKFAAPVIDRKIPWAAIFGNHDSEIMQDREHQMHIMSQMPYSLAQNGPKEVDGYGNYLIKLYSGDKSHTHIFSLYFLDSGDYQGRALPWEQHKYDYLKPSQLEWYRNVSSSIAPISRPFHPAKTSWRPWSARRAPGSAFAGSDRRGQETRQSTVQEKPNAIMWFHIPLQEAYADADVSADGAELDVGEVYDIGSGASEVNSHLLDEAILLQGSIDGEGAEGGVVPEVKVLSHGHCHLTERCRRVKGVWMCFDGGSSYSGYGMPDFERRVRIYRLSEYGEKVETYKRLVSGEIIDRQILVGA